MNRRFYRGFPVLLLAALLTGGCSQGHDDLDAWMAQQRQQVKPRVTPLKQPTEYVPLPYSQTAAMDPFSRERLTRVLKQESARSEGTSLLDKELARRKDPLEAYPLDVMSMVGTLDSAGKQVALVRVDRLLYQVHVGEHLGQNFGLVTKITDHEVTLREIVQDATGDWVERGATLQLQQEKKNG